MEQDNTNLEITIQYTLDQNKITIIACKGYGNTVSLPSFINGYSVNKIGPYAFSDPLRAFSILSDGIEILEEQIAGLKVPGSEKEYIYGQRLQEITLPEDLEVIDGYAFYNCKELSTVNMYGGKIRIDNGAFMNCEKLLSINVKAKPEDITGVRGILTELTSELCITFIKGEEKGVFIFPEYYEESIENISARVFQYQLHGAGYRYRQCFEQGKLNIIEYDLVFQLEEIQTIHETALNIAFVRLKYPYKLQEGLEELYLSYISKHIDKAVNIMIHKDNIDGLNFLTNLGIMSKEIYTEALEEAVRTGRRECAGILLKARLFYYPPKEKSFEL
ncbi:leucine-rich repeat domain-containing protein [Anaerocolumna sp. MB42-C2]|uniref:leucine-rich repeat domain-containing protein n=1 Tax=Anaerocolumna sp. MB42-C2 TaxID=3070997 RepID=UPI0027E1EBC2|nr:leucine-rich repeat domain-containing protein [Anaerocolumna sp. MB42-C2]WMJ89031.1 leucine-rich repeat domain-containing protein [Anaerocolumna sp. MB42-C2]